MSVVGGLFHVDPDSRHVPGCLSLAKPHRDKAITLPSRVSKVDPLGLRARPAPRRPTVRFPGEPPLRTASGPEATYSTRNSISIKKTITPSKRSASCDYPRSVAEIPRSTSSTDKKFVALSLPSRSWEQDERGPPPRFSLWTSSLLVTGPSASIIVHEFTGGSGDRGAKPLTVSRDLRVCFFERTRRYRAACRGSSLSHACD